MNHKDQGHPHLEVEQKVGHVIFLIHHKTDKADTPAVAIHNGDEYQDHNTYRKVQVSEDLLRSWTRSGEGSRQREEGHMTQHVALMRPCQCVDNG